METSSSVSSPAPEPSSSNDLPVMAMRKKIVEKVQENRVTLIIGEAGCGKSSQIPQFLLEQNMEPILCTQPRRFAVVAVARMVAKARKCEVGEEVGYHIGHSRVFSDRSKIIFKTAGVLLEEMRDKGFNALKYKVVILDEVHERSVESDLVLVCLKQFLLRNKDLRVVLMSATADIARYRDYFRDLGSDERVEVLAIPSTGQHTLFQRKVLYLEQVTDLLGVKSDDLSMKYCSGPNPSMADATVKPEVHKLIHDLVIYIHNYEPDIEKSILVFLPTYYSLEQQWFLLKPFTNCFKLHILHSSIDTEQALKAMKICKSHRKVILATNIAESSVTIPKVGYVIDSCRSLQVYWDDVRKVDSAKLDWVSKSQAEQRKGRTGRTCDGDVYRLVTGSFFSQLEEYEPPSILSLSLRQQVLLLCCAESKVINDPKTLFPKALDPPDAEVIEDALDLLVRIGALEKTSPRGRYHPTFYGRLLASFSLSFDASVLILKFGDIGMLREGILLGLMMDIQPLPIVRPFGRESLYFEYIDSYYSGDSSTTGLTGKKELVYMGNFRAFRFWQHVFKDKYRIERLKKLFEIETETWLPPLEEDWCSLHNLLQSALKHVAEMYHEILSNFHRFRPKFLMTSDALPSYSDGFEFWHTCFVNYEQDGYNATPEAEDEHFAHDSEENKCAAVPFLASNHHQADEVARTFADIVKKMRVQYAEDASGNLPKNVNEYGPHDAEAASLCKYFVRGICNRGSQCLFSHSLPTRMPQQAMRMPACKFFFSLQGCQKGDSCLFSHDLGPLDYSTLSGSNLCFPEDEEPDASAFLELLPSSSEGCVLLLDDTNFHFTSHLARQYDPSSIVVTTPLKYNPADDPSLTCVSILWGLSHPSQTILSAGGGVKRVPWNDVKSVLWFPNFKDENWQVHKGVLQTFFEYLAARILANSLLDIQVVLTMNNIRFSQLQVEKLARECFFFLQQSLPYDEETFGEVSDGVPVKKPNVKSRPVTYVFYLYPPTNIPVCDYATVLHRHVHDNRIVKEKN